MGCSKMCVLTIFFVFLIEKKHSDLKMNEIFGHIESQEHDILNLIFSGDKLTKFLIPLVMSMDGDMISDMQ